MPIVSQNKLYNEHSQLKRLIFDTSVLISIGNNYSIEQIDSLFTKLIKARYKIIFPLREFELEYNFKRDSASGESIKYLHSLARKSPTYDHVEVEELIRLGKKEPDFVFLAEHKIEQIGVPSISRELLAKTNSTKPEKQMRSLERDIGIFLKAHNHRCIIITSNTNDFMRIRKGVRIGNAPILTLAMLIESFEKDVECI